MSNSIVGEMEYKAVGFDYGGVIKGKPNTFFRGAVCELLGVTKEEYQQAYFRHSEKVNLGNMSWVEFWTDVSAELGQPDKVQHIMELSRETFGQPISQDILQLGRHAPRNGDKGRAP